MGHAPWMMIVPALVLAGCTQVRLTEPPRSATELYLLSTASEKAVKALVSDGLQGRLVFVDTKFLGDRDHQYLIAGTRARFLESGVRLTEDRGQAEIIVELRTPGVSIDRSEFLIGIPGFPIGQVASAAGLPPTPIATPELAVVKDLKQWGTAGIAYVAFWRESGDIIASSGPHIGRSFREDWKIFGASTTVGDIPPIEPLEAHDPAEEGQQP